MRLAFVLRAHLNLVFLLKQVLALALLEAHFLGERVFLVLQLVQLGGDVLHFSQHLIKLALVVAPALLFFHPLVCTLLLHHV